MKRKLKRTISAALVLCMVLTLLPGVALATGSQLTLTTYNNVDIALAVGQTSVGLSDFSDDLMAELHQITATSRGTNHGILPDTADINIMGVTSVDTSSSSNFTWLPFDHSYSGGGSANDFIDATGSQSTNDFNTLENHIVSADSGSTLTFYGYGSSGYSDFMFLENAQATRKTFDFALKEHYAADALGGFGFFCNSGFSYDTSVYTGANAMYDAYQAGALKLNGYLVFMKYGGRYGEGIYIYKVTNLDLKSFHAGSIDVSSTPYFTQIAYNTSNYPGSTADLRKLRIVANPDSIEVYCASFDDTSHPTDTNVRVSHDADALPFSLSNAGYVAFTNQTYSTLPKITFTLTSDALSAFQTAGGTGSSSDSIPIVAAQGRGGFGPMAKFRSHGCSMLTKVELSELSMSMDVVRSLVDVVREPEWQEGTDKFVVYVHDAQIDDFTDATKSGELLNRLAEDDIYYIGWANDENSTSSSSFLTSTGDKGVVINRALDTDGTAGPDTDYDDWVHTTAQEIYDRYWRNAAQTSTITVNSNLAYSLAAQATESLTNGEWYVTQTTSGLSWLTSPGAIGTNPMCDSEFSNLNDFRYTHAGVYTIYYGYDPASTNAPYATVTVHNAPVADFTFSVDSANSNALTLNNISYDPDVASAFTTDLETSGIEDEVWSYQKVGGASGTGKPAALDAESIYLVTLKVTDGMGAKSTVTKQISTKSGTLSNPYASFTVSPIRFNLESMTTNASDSTNRLALTDSSYSPNSGGSIASYEYKLYDTDGTTVLKTVTNSTPLTSFPFYDGGLKTDSRGTYTLKLKVTDNGGRVSEVVGRRFTVYEDVTAPTGSFTTPATPGSFTTSARYSPSASSRSVTISLADNTDTTGDLSPYTYDYGVASFTVGISADDTEANAVWGAPQSVRTGTGTTADPYVYPATCSVNYQLPVGKYTLYIKATDEAGNSATIASLPAEVSYAVNAGTADPDDASKVYYITVEPIDSAKYYAIKDYNGNYVTTGLAVKDQSGAAVAVSDKTIDSSTGWYNSATAGKLVFGPFLPGTLYTVMTAASASDPSPRAEKVVTPPCDPDSDADDTAGDPEVAVTYTTLTVEPASDDYEYRILDSLGSPVTGITVKEGDGDPDQTAPSPNGWVTGDDGTTGSDGKLIFTGLTPGQSYTVELRVKAAGGNPSGAPSSLDFTLPAYGSITAEVNIGDPDAAPAQDGEKYYITVDTAKCADYAIKDSGGSIVTAGITAVDENGDAVSLPGSGWYNNDAATGGKLTFGPFAANTIYTVARRDSVTHVNTDPAGLKVLTPPCDPALAEGDYRNPTADATSNTITIEPTSDQYEYAIAKKRDGVIITDPTAEDDADTALTPTTGGWVNDSTADGSTTTITFKDLDPGTEYIIYIRAKTTAAGVELNAPCELNVKTGSGYVPRTGDALVAIDGKQIDAGIVTTVKDPNTGVKDTDVKINPEVFEKQLEKIDPNAQKHQIDVYFPETDDKVGKESATLNTAMLKNADELKADVVVNGNSAVISIAPGTIDVEQLVKEAGKANGGSVKPEDIKVAIVSDPASAEDKAAAEKYAKENGLVIGGEVREYAIEVSSGSFSKTLDNYGKYLTVTLKGADADKITTSLKSIDGGKTFFHVPTVVKNSSTIYGGKGDYSVNTLGACIYCLVYNEEDFADAKGAWYQNVVNEMAARRIINGRDKNTFDGGANITRAEFAAIIVRALGIPENGTSSFSDVGSGAWYYGAVGKASEYGIITGYPDGSFAPTANITRQDAMLMIHRAAKVAEYVKQGASSSAEGYTDLDKVAGYAKEAMLWNLDNGLIKGSEGLVRPQDNITRAECATVVLRLLQKSRLIDVRSEA